MSCASTEQQHAINTICGGGNVFLTASAGTGKSWIINQVRSTQPNVVVCATTGLAAVNIQGRTWHSFFGWSPSEDPQRDYERNRMRNARGIRDANIVIIDEVSMMSAAQLEYLDALLRCYCDQSQPFGGKSIVLVGDVYQLDPVSGRHIVTSPLMAHFKFITLTKTYRQKDDLAFFDLLERVKVGAITDADASIIEGLREHTFKSGVLPTNIFCTNQAVDATNNRQLTALNQPIFTWPTYDNALRPALNACIGAQVMFVKNNTPAGHGIVNGTRGVVVDIVDKDPTDRSVIVELVNGKIVTVDLVEDHDEHGKKKKGAKKLFMPLRLAWAVSVHKSQGMTLDAALVNLSRVFAAGQVYTAISRVRNLGTLKVTNFQRSSIKVNPDVTKFIETVNWSTPTEDPSDPFSTFQ